MCTGGCAKCLGGTLIPLIVLGILANILLFFPGGKMIDNNEHLSQEVWFFGGILGSGVLVSTKASQPPHRPHPHPHPHILLKLGAHGPGRPLVPDKSPSIP